MKYEFLKLWDKQNSNKRKIETAEKDVRICASRRLWVVCVLGANSRYCFEGIENVIKRKTRIAAEIRKRRRIQEREKEEKSQKKSVARVCESLWAQAQVGARYAAWFTFSLLPLRCIFAFILFIYFIIFSHRWLSCLLIFVWRAILVFVSNFYAYIRIVAVGSSLRDAPAWHDSIETKRSTMYLNEWNRIKWERISRSGCQSQARKSCSLR